MKKLIYTVALCLSLMITGIALAHDSWLQANTRQIQLGDQVYVDLMMGNHGNHHRDFRVVGKVDIKAATLSLVDPQGDTHDIKDKLTDQGMDAKSGFWSLAIKPDKPGLYIVASTLDTVVSYAPLRSIKSAKTFFAVTDEKHTLADKFTGFDRVLGHDLELIPLTNPVTTPAGKSMRVQLLFQGKPLANTTVSFIPRGVTLKGHFDKQYERTTNNEGIVEFTPEKANYYLIVAHYETDTPGPNYKGIKYAATMVIQVPGR